jgi:uncharacterized protein YqgC (DUF456 family)
MDYLLVFLAGLCVLVGIAGSILPGLPGPPISFLGLVLLHWSRFAQFSAKTLIIWGSVIVIVSVLDYVVPVWGTKRYGGTKAGVRGSTIGLIIGVILLPLLGVVAGPFGLFGIIGGPFAGAWIAERSAGQDSKKALRSAFGSFIGFIAGTVMKIVVSLIAAVYFFLTVFRAIF